MSENPTTESTESTEPTPAPEPIENNTLERRKALGAARPAVAAKAGITVAQLARIELSAGKASGRTTADEVAIVDKALEALEAEKAEADAAAAEKATADAEVAAANEEAAADPS